MSEATVTITMSEYESLRRQGSKGYQRGYEDGLDTARRDFAEVNTHKNELIRTVEVLEGQVAELRAAITTHP